MENYIGKYDFDIEIIVSEINEKVFPNLYVMLM